MAHGGQADVVGNVKIVETDNRQIARHPQAAVTRGLENTQGLRIAGRKDGVRRRRKRKQAQRLAVGCFQAMRRQCDIIGKQFLARAFQGLPKADHALIAGVDGIIRQIGIAHKTQAPASQSQQVVSHQPPAGHIVNHNAAEHGVRPLDQNHIHLMGRQALHQPLGHALGERQGHDNDAIETAGQRQAGQISVAVG